MNKANTKKSGSMPLFLQKLNSIEKQDRFRNFIHFMIIASLSLSTIYFFIAYKISASDNSISNKGVNVLNINEAPKVNESYFPLLEIETVPLTTFTDKKLPVNTKNVPLAKPSNQAAKKESTSSGITFELTPK